jgi:glycosyltransferase involved in cell wall biosynthesis
MRLARPAVSTRIVSGAQSGRVMLIGPLPPPYGGTEAMTELLRRGSYGADFQLTFFDSSKALRNDERGHLRPKNVWLNLAKLAAFARALREVRPNVVWLPLAQNLMGFLRDSAYVVLARAAGAQVVLHFHGATFDRFYEHRAPLLRAYVRAVMGITAAVIVPGDQLHEQFAEIVPRLRRFTLYSALAADRFRELSQEHQRDQTSFDVVFVGHVSQAKGAPDLIRATAKARTRIPRIRVDLVGQAIEHDTNTDFLPRDQPSPMGPRALAEAVGVSEILTFRGAVPVDQVSDFLRRADLFVSPSYSEGFSVAMLEAMAAGLPLVLTRVGAAPEVLDADVNCIFVDPGAPDQLAAAIVRLAEDAELRARMGAANRELVASRFLEIHLQHGFARVASSLLPQLERAGQNERGATDKRFSGHT